MSHELQWYQDRNRAIEVRIGNETPTARYILRHERRTGEGHILHHSYDTQMSQLSLPAFILPLARHDGTPIPPETALALPTVQVLDAATVSSTPVQLILPLAHPRIASRSPENSPEILSALWLQGIAEADADAITREAEALRGIFIRPDESVRLMGHNIGRPLYLHRLPRVLFHDHHLIADNTDAALSMGSLFEELIQGFSTPEHAFPNVDLATGYLYHYGLVRILRILQNPAVRSLKLLFSGHVDRRTARALTSLVHEQLRDGMEHAGDDQLWQVVYEATKSGRLELRVYTDAFLHAKLFLGWTGLDKYNRLRDSRAAIGSSNLTRPGLGAGGNLELDVTITHQDTNTKLHTWFHHRWEESSPPVPDLLTILQSQRPLPRPTFEIAGLDDIWSAGHQCRLVSHHDHLAVLARLYAKRVQKLPDLTDDAFPYDPDRDIHPTIEQEQGVLALVERVQLSRLGFLADSVGLGKTITALGTAWYLLRMDEVHDIAVIAPQKLFQQWQDDATKIGFPANCLRFINRHALERSDATTATEMLEGIDFVIVEEAHEALRNRRNKLWGNLRAYLQTHRTCRVLLVSATPWNNRREDIYNYLLLAWQEGRLLQEHFIGLSSTPLREHIDRLFTIGSSQSTTAAARIFERLPLDRYRELFDQAFVQRTRASLTQRYGRAVINFPRRRVLPHTTPSTPPYDNLFIQLASALDEMNLSYRDPYHSLLRAAIAVSPGDGDPQDPIESNLQRSSLIQLYKRGESSIFALAISLHNIIHRLQQFRDQLDSLLKAQDPPRAVEEWLENAYLKLSEDAEEALEQDDGLAVQYMSASEKARYRNMRSLLGRLTEDRVPADDAQDSSLSRAIMHVINEQIAPDIQLIQELLALIDPDFDARSPKARELARFARQAHDQGHKPILVASYADTALRFFLRLITQLPDARVALALGGNEGWLYEPAEHDPTPIAAEEWSRGLSASPALRRQMLLGDARRARPISRDQVLNGFAPRARNATPESLAGVAGEIDILVGSEAISVGQNLQDSTCLIQLDLPWNPMVIEQRIGRIDRRGGGRRDPDHPDGPWIVDIHYCWSIAAIEQEVQLRQRLEHKAGRAMEDTNFDELLLHELLEKQQELQRRRARDEISQTEQERQLGLHLDEQQRGMVDEQIHVAGIPAGTGSDLDGLRLLAEWLTRTSTSSDHDHDGEVALACSMVPLAAGDQTPRWLLSIVATPLTSTGVPIPGGPLLHELPVMHSPSRNDRDHGYHSPGPALELTVRALLDGAPASARPGVYRRQWTQELLDLDRFLVAWRDDLLKTHNQECDARLQDSLTPVTRRQPTEQLRLLMQRARDALVKEIRRISGLPSTHPIVSILRQHQSKLSFLRKAALDPANLPVLLARQDPVDVEQFLLALAYSPLSFIERDFAGSFDRLCGAMYQQPAQFELETGGLDDRWGGLDIRVVAATYCDDPPLPQPDTSP